ncbi:hypothetical protein Q1695_003742 [Nippostrongylus brasiliensis]|nr:hypothetical protein Q1695_003742 [Nippostrongylus brasiliensis]
MSDKLQQKVCCRALISADNESDNIALSPFFECPGSGRSPHDCDTFVCSVRDVDFSDVVPDESDTTIRTLKFSSVFRLAQLISVYENEVDVDKRRYLMRSSMCNLVTVSGMEKAYTYFKRRCEHVLRALLQHDGSSIAVIPDASTKIEVAQLNDLTNAGVRFALTHSWDDVELHGPRPQVLLLLPGGFRNFGRIVKPEDTVTMAVYRDLKDACSIIAGCKDIGVCIFVTPTTERPCNAAEWQGLAMAITATVRCGTKMLAVSSPRGEAAWDQNRKDALEMVNVVKSAAMAMKNNVIPMFDLIPSLKPHSEADISSIDQNELHILKLQTILYRIVYSSLPELPY